MYCSCTTWGSDAGCDSQQVGDGDRERGHADLDGCHEGVEAIELRRGGLRLGGGCFADAYLARQPAPRDGASPLGHGAGPRKRLAAGACDGLREHTREEAVLRWSAGQSVSRARPYLDS